MINSKAINIIFILLILFSCKEIKNKTDIKSVAERSKPLKETTNPVIESFIKKMINEEHFKGVVLVAKNDKVIHTKGYGLAQDSIRNTIDTKFHVASITKQFTATAILQLTEKNNLNLEESINVYLPEHYRSDKWKNITIHHLLTHTSGIEDYAVTRDYYEVEKGFCLGNTVDRMIKEAMTKELNFPSGSKFAYSNIGFTLLGQIIENTTGKPFPIYLKENVLLPQEMYSSFIHTTDYSISSDEAVGYRWSDELGKHVLDDVVSLPVTQADGNLVTTLNDFYKWTDIYVKPKNRTLKDDSLKKMLTPFSKDDELGPDDLSQMYGYGISLNEGTICHSGYIVGFRSHFIVNPINDIRIFVFSNNVSNNPRDVSTGIYKILNNKNNDL